MNLGSQTNADVHYSSKLHQDAVKFQQNFRENKLPSQYYCENCSLFTTSYDLLLTHLNSDKHKSKMAIRELLEKSFTGSNQNMHPSTSTPTFIPTQQALEENSRNYCQLCRQEFLTSHDYAVHLTTEKHKLRVKVLDELEMHEQEMAISMCFSSNTKLKKENNSSSSSNSIASRIEPKSIEEIRQKYLNSDWCHSCYTKYSSDTHKQQHLNGKDHLRRFKLKEIEKMTNHENKLFCEICYTLDTSEIGHKTHMESINHANQYKRYKEYFMFHSINLEKTAIPKSISSSSVGLTVTELKKSALPVSISLHDFSLPKTNGVDALKNDFDETFEKSFVLNEEDCNTCEIFKAFNVKIYNYKSNSNEHKPELETNAIDYTEIDELTERLSQALNENMLLNINKIKETKDNKNFFN